MVVSSRISVAWGYWMMDIEPTAGNSGTAASTDDGIGEVVSESSVDEADGAASATWAGDANSAVSTLLAALRLDLAYGAYHPHERLVEADLTRRYQTTRGAVREALIELAAEGLIERAANRGARVRSMSIKEAIEIAEVRRSLESMCAARAAKFPRLAERKRILSLAESLRSTATTDLNAYLVINARFHATIYALSRHETARGILEHFQRRPIDLFFPRPFRAMPPSESVESHLTVARAIAGGDAAGAEAAMYEHLTKIIEALKQYEKRGNKPAI